MALGTSSRSDGTTGVVLTSERFNQINSVLLRFYRRCQGSTCGCSDILLISTGGVLLTRCSAKENPNLSTIAALASAHYEASTEIARLLNQGKDFSNHLLEGECCSLYVTEISDDFLLAVVFTQSNTFELLRIFAREAIPELRQLVHGDRPSQLSATG